MSLTKEQQKKLEKSGYRFVGNNGHAATKICHWTKQSILDKGVCYKEQFYGVKRLAFIQPLQRVVGRAARYIVMRQKAAQFLQQLGGFASFTLLAPFGGQAQSAAADRKTHV